MAQPVEVGLIAEAPLQLPWHFTRDITLPAEFPPLHSAFTFTRSEVDALGGLHIFRADYVEPADRPPQAEGWDHPHGAPQIAANQPPRADGRDHPHGGTYTDCSHCRRCGCHGRS